MAGTKRRRNAEKELPPEHYENLAKRLKGEQTLRANHAGSTERCVESAFKKWESYCNKMKRDPDELMKACEPQWFKSHLEWLLDRGQISKQSTLRTAWKFLRLSYVRKFGKMDPDVSLELTTYLEGPLTRRYGLDKSPKERPVMDVSDLFSLLHHHWTSDTGSFPHERYRVQLPLLLLLTAFTSSRPGTLVESSSYAGSNEGLLYRDIGLSLLRNPASEDGDVLVMEVTCRLMKGERNGKPKTYVMHERDDNPVFCPVLHLLALAFADNAFRTPDLTPENFFAIVVPTHRNSIEFQWRESILDTPVFRRSTRNGTGISPDRCLTDKVFRDQFRRLGLSAGFKHLLTPYAIRRGAGNAVDSVATSAERNQVMGHSRDDIFLRHYISQTVKVDVQSAFLGRPSRQELLKAAARLSRWKDLRAPTKISPEQRKAINSDSEIECLRRMRDTTRMEIQKLHGTVEAAKGTTICEEYTKHKRALEAELKHQEQLKLEEIREEFYDIVNEREIQSQISSDPTIPFQFELPVPVDYEFEERSRLSQLLFEPIPLSNSTEARHQIRQKLVEDMAKLCSLRESKLVDGQTEGLSLSLRGVGAMEVCAQEPEEHYPTVLPSTQCLFCLGDESLSQAARKQAFSRRDSLKRHVERYHFDDMDANQSFPCPHPTCSQQLSHRCHFMNHAAKVHNVLT